MKSLLCFILGFLFASATSLRAQELFESKTDPITVSVDKMYMRGLQFLARTQITKPGLVDGAWPDTPYGGEPAVAALSMVAMMAHGDDPTSGPYSVAIQH